MQSSKQTSPVGIIGLGRTGVAAARFLLDQGRQVLVWDENPAVREKFPETVGATLLGDAQSLDAFIHCSEILLSPGVPRSHPEVSKLCQAGIPVINDIEWLFRHSQQTRALFIAITGTNGKSTVTTLVGNMMEATRLAVRTGGNLGQAALSLWDPLVRYYVLELSSFQLESTQTFKPKVAAMLNISPDHLDRYAGMDDYLAAKQRIFINQDGDDVAIINADDPALWPRHIAHVPTTTPCVPFSIQQPIPGGVYSFKDQLIDHRGPDAIPLMPLAEIKITGRHNRSNAVAAAAIALSAGASAPAVVHTLQNFGGLPHRMEWVRTLDGVTFYNDSKGTNVGAVVQSLQSFTKPVVLIAGGRDKKGDFTPLANLATHLQAVVLIGEAAPSLEKVFKGKTHIEHAASMTAAVATALSLASCGTVLLSPACASFDMFQNFEDRGEKFREAVHAL